LASNFLIPNYAIKKEAKRFIKNPSIIKKEVFENLQTYSPKFLEITKNIAKHSGQLGLVYSSFVRNEGLQLFERTLISKGYRDKMSKLNDSNYNFKSGDSKYYAKITGNTTVENRNEILRIFTDKTNVHGESISLLLISSVGSEGIDLKNIRHIHIIEPFWNYSRIKQIIARAVRYKSHIDLPEIERRVQPYIYLSVYPSNYTSDRKKERYTTDESIWNNSLEMNKLNDEFLSILIRSSLDCELFNERFSKQIKCYSCLPDNKILYDRGISEETLITNPCSDITTETKEMYRFTDEDTNSTYYYEFQDDIPILYSLNENLNKYLQVPLDSEFYSDIVKKILKSRESKGGTAREKKIIMTNRSIDL